MTTTDRIFTLATAPARWLGRFRSSLSVALIEDEETFDGSKRIVFAILAALAVAYPIAAAVVHATVPSVARPEADQLIGFPFFVDVYSESLIFMAVAAGIGTFSPALGVLWMTVFIPTDLVAAYLSPPELQPLAAWEPWPIPLLARVSSYVLLWLLVVEIPVAVRRWAARVSAEAAGGRSTARLVAATAAGTAGLAFLWVRALPVLIQPIGTWTSDAVTTLESTNAAFLYWPVLVVAATALAAVSAVWPPPVRIRGPQVGEPPVAPRRSLGATLIRQVITIPFLLLLLAGMLTSVEAAAIAFVGLVVTGPILTLVMPRLAVQWRTPRPGSLGRVLIGLGAVAAASAAMLFLAGDALEGYVLMATTLAVTAPLLRLVLELGTPESPAQPARSGGSAA